MSDTPLRARLAAHGLLADKRFGQHFLLDLNITRKIVRLAGDLDGRTVIEVGPGPGGLTLAILESPAICVHVIEKDPRFLPLLSELADPRLTVQSADALEVDAAQLGTAPRHIIANLPYNVGTPLLIGWLKQISTYEQLTLMFQLEVAERLVAQVGDGSYGRLAVLVQAVATARLAMRLPARAFTPPPKVDSAVVVIRPLDTPLAAHKLADLERVTAAAFGQRRKMLRQSLKPLGGGALCARAGIAADRRAETLSVAEFLHLVDALQRA